MIKTAISCLIVLLLFGAWGFHAHRSINILAVYMLPPEMSVFYKKHLSYLKDAAVQPDRRRYAVPGEAECHFMDMDHYDSLRIDSLSRETWEQSVARFGEDSLRMHGILPWNLVRVYRSLRYAFIVRDAARVLRLSADLGHYAGDAHVPLHTTANYDGQLTGQHGLHGLWESRLPELHEQDYDFLLGRAQFEPDVRRRIWEVLRGSQSRVDSVLALERQLFSREGNSKFTFESKGGQTIRVVSASYARKFHRMLGSMVEQRMRGSVRLAADLWYSAWVEAGQPDLREWDMEGADPDATSRNKQEFDAWGKRNLVRIRPHETGPD